MALVIEDGTVVAGANSFVTVEEAREFALARGVELSEVDADVEVLSQAAIDFIVSNEARLAGTRTDPDNQELPYPRTGVSLYGAELLENSIPSTLKKAQMQLMLDSHKGVPLVQDDTAEPAVKREKIGPIDTEFFGPDVAATGGALAIAWGYLQPLLRGQGFGLRTVRV